MENELSARSEKFPTLELPGENRFRVLFFLLTSVFAAEGFDFFSYPLLAITGIAALYCFYQEGFFSRLNRLPFYVRATLLLFVLTAVSPGFPLKDLPVADKMLAAYLSGFAAAFFIARQLHYAMLALPVSIVVSWLICGLSGFSEGFFLGERLVLFSGNPNKLSFITSFAIIISVVFRQHLHGYWRHLNRVALALCILTIILSSSRASILGLVACLAFWVITILRKRLGRIVLLVMIAFIGGFWCLPYCEVERMKMTTDPIHDTAFQKRLFIWSVAVKGITESPLLGNSMRGFRNYYAKHIKDNEAELVGKPFFEEDILDVSHPHNVFLGVLFGYGALGSTLILVIFLPALKNAYDRRDYLFFSALLFNLVSGLFEFYLHRVSGALFIFLPLGIIHGSEYYKLNQPDPNAQPGIEIVEKGL